MRAAAGLDAPRAAFVGAVRADAVWPEGLALIEEAVTASQEQQFLALLADAQWDPSQCGETVF